MLKIILKLSFFSLLAAFCLFNTSCENTDSEANAELDQIVETEEFSQEAVFRIDEEASTGRGGCFEFVFPISVAFGDENIVEFENYPQLKEAIKRWRENNPTTDRRPQLQYPVDIMTNGGRLITVEGPRELKALKNLCDRWQNWNGAHDCEPCFKLVYPIGILFPNGEVYEAPDARHLKLALLRWKKNHPGEQDARPMFNYPIEVTQGDEVITVESGEDLKALKEACMDE